MDTEQIWFKDDDKIKTPHQCSILSVSYGPKRTMPRSAEDRQPPQPPCTNAYGEKRLHFDHFDC